MSMTKGDRLGINIDLPEHPDLVNIRGAINQARAALKMAAAKSGIKIHILPYEIHCSDIDRAGRKHKANCLHQEAVVK